MPQLANIVINDGAATPVAHTFTPRDIVNGVGTLIESTGIPIGDNRLSLGLTRTSAGRYKPTVKLVLPIVQTQTVNGVSSPVVVRTAYAELSFNFDATSTTQERKDAVALSKNALANSIVLGVAQDLQGVY